MIHRFCFQFHSTVWAMLAIVFGSAMVNGDESLFNNIKYSIGISPSQVVVEDFNNDGALDFATANRGFPGSVSIGLGDGQGSFFEIDSLEEIDGATSIVADDFNLDGTVDIAISKFFAAEVDVYIGNGDGTFSKPESYTTGVSPKLVKGDFDGNGIVDIATINSFDISVLFGVGDGTFSVSTAFPLSVTARGFAVLDFNGDAVDDLVMTVDFQIPNGGDGIVFLSGNGDGSFESTGPVAAGFRSFFVVSSDLTDDGIDDLIMPSLSTNEIFVFVGGGNGAFQMQAPIQLSGFPTSNVTVTDFDSDGLLDIVVGSQGFVSVAHGNGDGSFAAVVDFETETRPASVASGDFDSDGSIDLVSANSSHDLSVLLTGSHVPLFRVETLDSPNAISAADFNNDGIVDLATAHDSSDAVAIILGDKGGAFVPPQKLSAGDRPWSLVNSDFDADGFTDLAVCNLNSNDISVFLGNGDGTFAMQQLFATGANPTAIDTADLDSDGIPDLITSGISDFATAGQVSVLFGVGDGSFEPAQILASGSADDLVVADFDDDGNLDIASSISGISLLFGTGAGQFSESQSLDLGVFYYDLAAGDFNSDGKIDLAATRSEANRPTVVSLFFNQGNGVFSNPNDVPVGISPSGIAADDVDGDGQVDLLVLNSGSDDASVLLGRGDGTFEAEQIFPIGPFPTAMELSDFNSDGIVDLAATGPLDNTITILMGQEGSQFVLGDVNLDCELNLLDITRFVELIVEGGFQTEADINGDGVVDLLDVLPFVELISGQS